MRDLDCELVAGKERRFNETPRGELPERGKGDFRDDGDPSIGEVFCGAWEEARGGCVNGALMEALWVLKTPDNTFARGSCDARTFRSSLIVLREQIYCLCLLPSFTMASFTAKPQIVAILEPT